MTTSKLDEICPPTVGEFKIKIQLATPDIPVVAYTSFEVDLDYSAALPEGVSLPLEVLIQGPETGQVRSKIFRKAKPIGVVLKPFSGGRHFILVRELFHNRWQGQMFVDVQGPDQNFTRG